jgi:uncharacterized protein (DUF983 family)
MSPVAAVMSALFPVAADLSKSGSGGNPHGLALFTGMMVVGTLSSIPAAIVAIVDHRMHQPLWALALVAAWTAIAVAIAVPTLKMAAGAVASRRESLVLAARER